jgi:hypothetical protein
VIIGHARAIEGMAHGSCFGITVAALVGGIAMFALEPGGEGRIPELMEL